MVIFFIVLLSISIILEASITTIPFIVVILLFLAVFYQKAWVFFLGLIAGILFDSLSFRPLGESSMFFLVFLYLVFLYRRKFEIDTLPFFIIANTIASICFLILLGADFIPLQTVVIIFFTLCLFFTIKIFFQNKKFVNKDLYPL